VTSEGKLQLQIAEKDSSTTAISLQMIPMDDFPKDDFFLGNVQMKRCLDRRIFRGDDRAYLRECDNIRAQRFRFTPEEKLNL
jgi:hypothetical protein